MSLDHYLVEGILEDIDYQGFYPGAVSPSGRYVLTNKYRALWVLDRQDETFVKAFNPDTLDSYNGIAIDDEGTVYVLSSGEPAILVKIPEFATGDQVLLDNSADHPAVAGIMRLFVMPDDSQRIVWADGDPTSSTAFNIYNVAADTISTVANPDTLHECTQIVQDSYGDIWAVSFVGDTIIFQRIFDTGLGTAADDYTTIAGLETADTATGEVYHSSAGWFVSYSGGTDLYLFDDEDFSQLAHRSYAATGSFLNSPIVGSAPFLLGLAPGASSFWFPGPNSFEDWAYSDLHKITAATLASALTYEAEDWLVGDQPDVTAGMIYSTYGREALISQSLQDPPSDIPLDVGDYTTVLRYFIEADTPSGGGGGDGLQDESVRLRVWGYSLDGHDYYVLRVGPSESLVFDLTTNTWSSWASPGRENWRAHIGQNWIGMSEDTFALGFGSDVVAGDDASGVLWILDPTAGRDDRSTTGDDPFNRVVTGGLSLSGRETAPCGALQIDYSVGNPTQIGASFTLETSDDWGNTFDAQGTIEVAAGDLGTAVEWRALGQAKAPGRVFRITDNGAAVRISGADLR